VILPVKIASDRIEEAPRIKVIVESSDKVNVIEMLPDMGADICAGDPEFLEQMDGHENNLIDTNVRIRAEGIADATGLGIMQQRQHADGGWTTIKAGSQHSTDMDDVGAKADALSRIPIEQDARKRREHDARDRKRREQDGRNRRRSDDGARTRGDDDARRRNDARTWSDDNGTNGVEPNPRSESKVHHRWRRWGKKRRRERKPYAHAGAASERGDVGLWCGHWSTKTHQYRRGWNLKIEKIQTRIEATRAASR